MPQIHGCVIMQDDSTRKDSMMLSVLERLRLAFKDVSKSLHKLFLEITGFLFALFGAFLLLRGYQFVSERNEFEFKDYFIIASFFVFGLLMLGFGIHSFYRLRSMK